MISCASLEHLETQRHHLSLSHRYASSSPLAIASGVLVKSRISSCYLVSVPKDWQSYPEPGLFPWMSHSEEALMFPPVVALAEADVVSKERVWISVLSSA